MSIKTEFRKSVSRVPLTKEGAAFMREKLYALPEWQSAQSIFIYVSVFPEPDTRVIISDALALGKRVAVPRVLGKGKMLPLIIDDMNMLSPGVLNILQPPLSCPVMDKIDLAVIPCVACDTSGNRLGHGGGYYDRFLSENRCFSVCLCPSGQLFERVPTDENDVKPDLILTELGFVGAIAL